MLSRRDLLRRAVGSTAALAGCGGRSAGDLPARIDAACRSAARALVAAQSEDGAWRSPTYGIFRDGLTLTPAVLKAVAFSPDVPGSEESRRRGAAYLAGRIRADGSIDDGPTGLVYPVYTAAASAIVLSRVPAPGGTRARDAWLAEVRRRQLDESLGWSPDDPAHGGWGYAVEPSRKGTARAADADLSSTLFAVGALGVSNAGTDGPALAKALRFVERCQNPDGGFFFSPTDPVRNKAGGDGPGRFYSYGSATADGLRALLRCGRGPDHPRVEAARAWLARNASATTNPGTFEPIRETEREATYYYYAWSLAHAARALGRGRGFGDRWAEDLSRELIRRQRPDGTWSNRFTASKEDDPLVATSFAAGALGLCRLAPALRDVNPRAGSP